MKLDKKKIFGEAWEMSREDAEDWGGKPSEYFGENLKFSWRKERNRKGYIRIVEKKAETEKALKLKLGIEVGDDKIFEKEIWLPKKSIQVTKIFVIVPRWLRDRI